MKNSLDQYFELLSQRPSDFNNLDANLVIETDRAVIENYAAEKGVRFGVVYRSAWNTMIVDLVRSPDGRRFPYERIIPTSDGKPVVCLTMFQGKFVLLKQYRHALRRAQLSCPRGFGENGLSARENAIKEINEELGATVVHLEELGEIAPDSGLTGVVASTFLCQVENFETKKDYEGILDVALLSEKELVDAIASAKLDDAFTLAAYSLYRAKRDVQKNECISFRFA